MRYTLLLSFLLFIIGATNASAREWSNRYPGGDERLVYNSEQIARIRQRIDQHDWAAALYERMKREIDTKEAYAPSADIAPKTQRSKWTKDAALLYRIDEEEHHLPEITDNIVAYFKLDKPDRPLFERDTIRNYENFWQWGWYATLYLEAYDLIKHHPLMQPHQPLMERRMGEVIETGERYARRITRLGNTQFWGITTLGVFGFMKGDDHAINEAINGRSGFKAALMKFRDEGRFWPEPPHYSIEYVDCCMLILAETARQNGYAEDLHHYVAPNGASILRGYESLFTAVNPNGIFFENGDHSEFPMLLGDRLVITQTPLLTPRGKTERQYLKSDLYHALYHTPTTAWAASLNPERSDKCWVFWGYTALTHGTEIDGGKIPKAASVCYPEMGNAFIKSIEGEEYWHSDAITVHLRNGASQQYHSHNDHLSMVIAAYGKNIYNDWFLRWDYLAPRPGRANYTPYSQRIVSHNTVMVDCQEPPHSLINYPRDLPEWVGLPFSPITKSGPIQRISCGGELYAGVEQVRTLYTTPEYVLDLFALHSDAPHTYDYMLHTLGSFEARGVGKWESYDTLREEYRLAAIDDKSQRDDRWWLMNNRRASVTKELSLRFIDSDGIGMVTTLLYEPKTEMLATSLPYFVSTDGWDKTNERKRRPMVIVRRHATESCFVALHQPTKGEAFDPIRIKRKGNRIEVSGKRFTDYYDLDKEQFYRVAR